MSGRNNILDIQYMKRHSVGNSYSSPNMPYYIGFYNQFIFIFLMHNKLPLCVLSSPWSPIRLIVNCLQGLRNHFLQPQFPYLEYTMENRRKQCWIYNYNLMWKMNTLTSKTLSLPIGHIANFKLVPFCLHICRRNIPMRQGGQRRDTKLVYTTSSIIIMPEQAEPLFLGMGTEIRYLIGLGAKL